MKNYLMFILRERRLLSFGVSFTFFSNVGQTFLISLFVPFFLEAFVLSNAGFGTLYSGATLISAMALPWFGRWIDRIPLRTYSFAVAGGLLIASLVMMAAWHVAVLFIGIVLLRLVGQGLSGHTAQTTMARNFDGQRGKALSVSSLGYPLGEAILPVAVAGLLVWVHWKTVWGLIALIIAVVLFPLIYLLVGRNSVDKNKPAESAETARKPRENYSIIFSDPRTLYSIPSILIPPFWFTGLFLYQISIGADLGWTPQLIATAFICFALFRIIGSVMIGPVIDRYSAQVLFPFYLAPMILALFIPLFFTANIAAFVYMALLGLTLGINMNIKSALWAEIYGTAMIGTAQSLFAAMMVLSTAVSPFLIGWILDLELPVSYIFIAGIVSSVLAALLSFKVHPKLNSVAET